MYQSLLTNAKQQGSCGDRDSDKPDRASVGERDEKDHTSNAKLPSTDNHSTSSHPATAAVNTEREHTANPMKKKFAYQLNQQAAISHNSDSSPSSLPVHPAQTEPTTNASTAHAEPDTTNTHTVQGPDQSHGAAMALEEPGCHSENSSITEEKAQTPTLRGSIIALPTPHTTTSTTTTTTAPATGTRIPLELGMSLAWYTTQSIDQLRRQQPDVYTDIVSDRERFDKWFLSKQRR